MKTIKLAECQMHLFKMLLEGEGNAPDFEDGDIKEYGDTTENGITATIHDDEDNPKYGKMFPSEKIKMCPQNYWANTMNGGRMMP